jgi:hypothetical protein
MARLVFESGPQCFVKANQLSVVGDAVLTREYSPVRWMAQLGNVMGVTSEG